jgi:AcrR family transcriptional regulator
VATPERYPRRAEQARATKRRVVAAATALFLERGYASTSMAAIASAADVADQTVYAAFGTKRAILSAALDQAIAGDDRPVVVNDRDWMRVVLESTDARARLECYAKAVRRIHDGASGMFEVLAASATIEPELAAMWAEAQRRRRVGVTSVVAPIAEWGALRESLDAEAAIDIVWSLNGHEVYRNLVVHRGWAPERYETWLGTSLVELLLGARRQRRKATDS